MIVLAQKYGRLGNRLCLFAHLIACARQYNIRLLNLSFFDYAHYFTSTCQAVLPSYPRNESNRPNWLWTRPLTYRLVNTPVRLAAVLGFKDNPVQIIQLDGGQQFDLTDETFVGTARERLVLLRGWLFRCEELFTRHADAIREYFRPIERHRANVQRVVNAARRDAEVLVGVHIRHGDYQNFRAGKYFYSIEFYRARMRQMAELLAPRSVRFLVCTDGDFEPNAFGDLPVTVGPGHLIEDMYALAGCDYMMGPPSTFSYWASFYGEVPLWHIKDSDESVRFEAFHVCGMAKPRVLEFTKHVTGHGKRPRVKLGNTISLRKAA